MKLTNGEINEYITILNAYLNRSDMLGYAAARNVRFLKNAYEEYDNKRSELIAKYGEQEVDDNEIPTGRFYITPKSKNILKFITELKPYAVLEHEVTIFKIPYSEVIGELTGSEILEIDWMLEDSDKPEDV